MHLSPTVQAIAIFFAWSFFVLTAENSQQTEPVIRAIAALL